MSKKLTKNDLELMQWLWRDEQRVAWIETFIKIRNKEGKVVPFKLTKQQNYFLSNIERHNILDKLRQNGMSVASLAEMLRLAITKSNSVSAIYSYEADSALDNFNKLKNMYDYLPTWITEEIKLTRCNDNLLEFSNGSQITARTVGDGKRQKGKGKTVNSILHLTEFSYYAKAEDQLNSLIPACSSSCKVIIESTANGVGNTFHQMWVKAVSGENDYKAFFFPWYEARELYKKDYELSLQAYKKQNGKLLEEDELDNDEMILLQNGAELSQLIWRRMRIASGGVNGLNKFKQEYPSTWEESFLQSGECYFNMDKVNEVLRSILIDGKKGNLVIPKSQLKDLPPSLIRYYNSEFKVYHKVDKNKKYYIGCDSASGTKGDYTVVVVFNEDKEEVAMFRSNKILPYAIADIIFDIGMYYNQGLIIVERNHGSGQVILERLQRELKYRRLYYGKNGFDKNRKSKKSLGFYTDTSNKERILNNFAEMFMNDLIQLNSKEIIEEMKTFVDLGGGKLGAIRGCHDDTIMAISITLQAIKEGAWKNIWI